VATNVGGGVLDDVVAVGRMDAGGMLAAIETLPGQIRDAWARSRKLQLGEPHRAAQAVALLGMGGSAVGADLVRGVFSDRLRVPLSVVRDYELPASVQPSTLVVAVSYSGSTEETISALATALERRCPVAVITTGGTLHDVARRANLPLLDYPGGSQPRAAIGYSLLLFAGLLERAGLLQLDDAEVESTAATAAAMAKLWGPSVATERNLAKQLAWSLVDRLPVIEAAGFLAPVARRWKTQFNENSKSMAVAEELPEATHNTVVGYQQPESIRDHLYVVFLASPSDHPRNSLRASLSAELLGKAQIAHQVVPIAGDGRLAQAIAAISLGDHVSTYLAMLYGLDPTPVEAISHIKERLLERDEDAED
jgi:glucose/mannose-6-phosphate isomerase